MQNLSGPIKTWSLSRLEIYEGCPFRAKLQYVDKVPQPELVPPEGKDEHPLIRGRRVHNLAEDYVTKNTEMFPELERFSDEFMVLRDQYRDDTTTVTVEQDWAISLDWSRTGWFSDDTWGRLKLDVAVKNGTHLRVIDHKTGRKYGTKHINQGQLYGLVGVLRNPEIETVSTEFWYLDNGEVSKREYSKVKLLIFQDSFDQRARTMCSATTFRPHPSAWSCRYCPYSETENGNGKCPHSFPFDK